MAEQKIDLFENKLLLRSSNPKSVSAASNLVKEYLTFQDLSAFESSPAAVREKFKSIYKTNPDGLALNDQTYFEKAVKPAITEQYGHYCYKTLDNANMEYSKSTIDKGSKATVGTHSVENQSDNSQKMQFAVTGSWTEETNWTSSVTTGMSFTEKITLEGFFEIGWEFNVSTTTGKGGSSSQAMSSTATVEVTVPPNSRMKVDMVATFKKAHISYQCPIQANGYFGANFPKKVGPGGHFYWFESTNSILPKQSGQLNGTIEQSKAFDVQTVIGKPTPI